MPNDSTRVGGYVPGTTPTDTVKGAPVEVAKASYEPGYDLGSTLKAGYVNAADLKQGYCSYGKATGE